MPEKYRVGVVGFGEMGQNHARIWADMPDAELVAIADQDPARYVAAAEQYPQCYILEGMEEMLNYGMVDIVVVATQAPFHCAHTMLALQQGCHVICEKPMALTLNECDTMVNAAKAENLLLAVHHQAVFSRAVARAEELITQGLIGRVYAMRGVGKGRLACYDLMEIGGHILHLMRHFGGEVVVVEGEVLKEGRRITEEDIVEIKTLYPAGRACGKGAGDYIYGRYSFSSGVRATLELATVELPVYDSRYMCLVLQGTKGQLRINFPSRSELWHNQEALDTADQEWLEEEWESTRDHDSRYTYPMRRFAEDFLESVEVDARPKVFGEDGLAVMEMTRAIYAVHFHQAPIYLPNDSRRYMDTLDSLFV